MIPAIVLAAGQSSRMGRPKLLLPAGYNDTFLSRIVRTFTDAGIEDVVVVVSGDPQPATDELARLGLRGRVVVNPAPDRGQLSSLLVGIDAIDRGDVEAVLVTLVDVPLVAPATVRKVLEHYAAAKPSIVRPVSGDRHGHPVLVDRGLFGELRAADPARGARPVVRAHLSEQSDVEVTDEGAFVDIDTPDDFARWVGSPLQ